jgi:hypothetical protein
MLSQIHVNDLVNLQASLDGNCPLTHLVFLMGWNSERTFMPGKKHLRGVGEKEQREYEHIKESAQRSGRYGSRAKEVAARTVMKQHKAKGHRTGQ